MPEAEAGGAVAIVSARNCRPRSRSATHWPRGVELLAGGDGGDAPDDGRQLLAALGLDPEDGEAVLGIVIGDALDDARQAALRLALLRGVHAFRRAPLAEEFGHGRGMIGPPGPSPQSCRRVNARGLPGLAPPEGAPLCGPFLAQARPRRKKLPNGPQLSPLISGGSKPNRSPSSARWRPSSPIR